MEETPNVRYLFYNSRHHEIKMPKITENITGKCTLFVTGFYMETVFNIRVFNIRVFIGNTINGVIVSALSPELIMLRKAICFSRLLKHRKFYIRFKHPSLSQSAFFFILKASFPGFY